jgi:prolactin regulatory element-binding protein
MENNGYIAYEVQRYDTDSLAIMNCAVGSFDQKKRLFLAAGKDADCDIYQLKLSSRKNILLNDGDSGKSGENSAARKRKARSNSNSNGSVKPSPTPKSGSTVESPTDLAFDIQAVLNVTTDFSPKDPCQNAVTFSLDGRLVLTGGADGILRVWTFPEMQLKTKIEISKKEISDLDISPDRKFVSCVSKDGRCKIWSLADGKVKTSMDLPPEDAGKFFYKRCKFGVVQDKRNCYRLYVVLNPTNYKQNKSYLQHWTGPDFSLTKVAVAGETLSALAVSRCGRYLAVGSMTNGDVDIYVAFSLQRLRHIEHAHKTFVTGLTFLPPAQVNEESVLGNCDAAVVSISVDNQIHVHHIDRTEGISMWLAVILIIFVLVGTFTLCSYIGL